VESAFLKCVTDDPDDVTARLVFADWLREQDDPARNERGEFIHAQHALAAGTALPAERPRLRARQNALLERHRERWEGPFRGLIGACEYRNGFAERVTVSAEQFVDAFAELVVHTPVVRVYLSGLTADTVEVLAATEALAGVRELDVSGTAVAPATLAAFLASPHLTRLRSLNLARTGVGDAGVRALVASPVFRRLRYLNLAHADFAADGLSALLRAIRDRTTALQQLVLRGATAPVGAAIPLPDGVPHRLRQSLRAFTGRTTESQGEVFESLYRERAALPADLRRWVEWLRASGFAALPRAVTALPLPDPLRRAFVRVCQRRLVWRASRAGFVLPDEDGGSEDLPRLLRLLLDMGDGREGRALAECLLDLYQRHERGELPEDGRTR
jgi:uncharacterized protein (TIGR02996 family)